MMKLSISVTNFFMAVPNQHAARQIGFCRGVSRHHHSRHAVGARSSVAGRPHQQPRPTDAGGIHNARLLAARSSPIRLGTAVTAATFRAPALLIKAVTTVGVLSGGRAWLGLGAGYNDEEAGALGRFMAPVAGGS